MLTYIDLVLSNENTTYEADDALTTGIRELDRITGGLRASRLWLVKGPSQSGRTTLALQVARLAAEARYPTAFLAGADPASRLGSMLLSGTTGIPRLKPTQEPVGDTWSTMHQYTLTAHYPEGRVISDLVSEVADANLVVVDDLDLWEQSSVDALDALVSMCESGQRVLVTAPDSALTSMPPVAATAWSRAIDLQMHLINHRHSTRLGEIDLNIVHHRDGPLTQVTAAFQGALARIVDLE